MKTMDTKTIALFRASDGAFDMVINVTGYDDKFQAVLDSAAAGYPYSGKSFKEILAAEASDAGYSVSFPSFVKLSA